MAKWHGGQRFPLRGRKSLPLASPYGAGLALMAPHGSTRPDELVQGSDPRLRGGGIGYRFYPGGVGVGGGHLPQLHNLFAGKQGGSEEDQSFYHFSAAEWGVLRDNQPFGAGGVLYADAAGKLQTDAANLLWNAGDKQLVVAVGSAAKPAYTFAGRTTDGLFSLAAGQLGLATSGVLRVQVLDTITYFHDQTVRIRSSGAGLRSLSLSVDDVNSVTVIDTSWSTIGGYPLAFRFGAVEKMRLTTAQLLGLAGSAALPFYSFATYPTQGMYAVNNGILGWATASVLKMSLNGGGVLWLLAHNPSLTAEGQMAMDSVHKTKRWYMGGMQCLGASLIDDARVADATVTSSGGTLAETAVSTHTLPAAFNVAGNTAKIVAKGTAILYPRGSTGSSTMYIYFRIEGTNVLTLAFSAVYGEEETWITFEFSCEATMRSATTWEITNVKGRAADSSEGTSPWPYQVTPGAEVWHARKTPFTVSGDVTTQVRCSIANSTGGDSTCTVHKHQAGLEQT